ncbi:MAG: orotate phosphoribosyltransferase [Planctomycetes bacterium]|nr:orotate phosphoribosyltransferase [Planctomycetota bacterium]
MYDRQRLIELFKERALKFGEFTLASGQKSSYYLDGKQVTLFSEGLRLAGEGLFELLEDLEFAAVGGMSIGADPLVAAVLTIAAERGRPLEGFLVRKEAKGHGTRRFVEGPVAPGTAVVVLDDVVTTGGSTFAAIERIQEFGCRVVGAAAVVDRLQGGAAGFRERGVEFRTLLTVEDFGIRPG